MKTRSFLRHLGLFIAGVVSMVCMVSVPQAAAAPSVVVENKCSAPMTVNEVTVQPAGTSTVSISNTATLQFRDATGTLRSATFAVPADVTGVVIVCEGGLVKVKVKSVAPLLGLVKTLIGLDLAKIEADL